VQCFSYQRGAVEPGGVTAPSDGVDKDENITVIKLVVSTFIVVLMVPRKSFSNHSVIINVLDPNLSRSA